MALDPREFIRVHNGMPEHPKVDPLSDSAFRALVSAWCLCSRTRNDGRMPLATWNRFKPKARRELIEAGLVHLESDAAVVHDYLEHQPSKADLEARRAARAEAGREGGRRSGESRRSKPATKTEANGSHSAKHLLKQTRSKNEPELEKEKEPSGYVESGTTDSNARDFDDAPGPRVDVDGWKLVRPLIGLEHPQGVRSDLAIRAGALLKSGTPEADVRAALELWLTKPNLGPGTLPSLVSEVVKSRNRPAQAGQGAATAKAEGWLEVASELANPNQKKAIQR